MNNIGFLAADNGQPELYYISEIAYTENPEEIIPENCIKVSFANIEFTLRYGPKYYWNSVECAVVRLTDGFPLFLIGDFYKK